MFTVNHGISVLALCKFGDSFSGGDAPAPSAHSNWPFSPGHNTGYRVSTTPDIQVVDMPCPDVGAMMEKAQRLSAQTRDSAALGIMTVSRVIRDTQKSMPKI